MGIEDEYAAYCLDGAVSLMGVMIENALQEMDEVGPEEHRRRVPRYTLRQLLDPEFTLPRQDNESSGDDLAVLRGADGGLYDEVT